jgi:hypothetical protein
MSAKVAHRITKTIGYTLGIIIVWVPWFGLGYLMIVDPPLGWSLWTLWFVLARNRELNRAATAYFNPLLLLTPIAPTTDLDARRQEMRNVKAPSTL